MVANPVDSWTLVENKGHLRSRDIAIPTNMKAAEAQSTVDGCSHSPVDHLTEVDASLVDPKGRPSSGVVLLPIQRFDAGEPY
jgi:hypothetical protein